MLGSSPRTRVLFLSCLSGGFFATRGLLREGVSFGCWMWAAKPPVMLESECGSLFPLLFPSGCFSSFCASGFAFSHQKEQVHVCSACRCELDFLFLVWRILALQCWLVSGAQWREPAVGVHTSPPSWTPLFPVPTIPLCHHRAPSPAPVLGTAPTSCPFNTCEPHSFHHPRMAARPEMSKLAFWAVCWLSGAGESEGPPVWNLKS